MSFYLTLIGGEIPSEIAYLRDLDRLDLFGTLLVGSIPKVMCSNSSVSHIRVNCRSVVCDCCGCPAFSSTLSPSLSPSSYPIPTTTITSKAPTSPVPSKTSNIDTFPAQSSVTTSGPCSNFIRLSSHGTLLPSATGRVLPVIKLPFPFTFNTNGGEVYSNITVVAHLGAVSMGDEGTNTMCSRSIAAGSLLKNGIRPTIGLTGTVYTAYDAEEESFLISWEDVSTADFEESSYSMNFQIVLFSDGRIEMRWGEGIYPSLYELIAIVATPCLGEFYPIDVEPFVNKVGPAMATDQGFWPSNQCAIFSPKDYGYTVVAKH